MRAGVETDSAGETRELRAEVRELTEQQAFLETLLGERAVPPRIRGGSEPPEEG